jgi:hypothetical protein
MIDYPTATTPTDFVIRVSLFQGSLRKSITQHRTSSLRATATIAFFLRVYHLTPPLSQRILYAISSPAGSWAI